MNYLLIFEVNNYNDPRNFPTKYPYRIRFLVNYHERKFVRKQPEKSNRRNTTDTNTARHPRL